MMWDLPLSVNIDGEEYKITNKCDYRMVLDVICALNDKELTEDERVRTALYVFYEDISGCRNLEQAVKEMYKIISYEEHPEQNKEKSPKVMDWERDFPQIAPPVSRVLGYDIRTPGKYVHWFTFLGGYMEIGECTFRDIVGIRSKLKRGAKLDENEKAFYRVNKRLIDMQEDLTDEEQEFLSSEW